MSLADRCLICRKPDLRRLIELGWNAKMNASDLAAVFGNIPSSAAILKHIREHVEEGASIRAIPVEDARPLRQRVLDIQRIQVEEIERRITRAQEWAARARELGNEDADWSEAFDILGKDMQSAVASILRAQGLTDKRETKEAGLKVDLYRLMLGDRGGLAPTRLIESGDAIEGEIREVGNEEA